MSFKNHAAAVKAAQHALGEDAREGLDFVVNHTDDGYTFQQVPAASDAAKGAQAERGISETPLADRAADAQASVAKKRAARKSAAEKPARAKKTAAKAKAPPKAKKAPSKKPPASAEGFTVKPGSKTEKLVKLLQRPGGASSRELEEELGWLPHSVRGALGTFRARGIEITATKPEGEKHVIYAWPKTSAPATAPAADEAVL